MQNSKMFTRTIPRTPVLGKREVCFRSPKLYQHSPIVQQCRIQKLTRGQNHVPWTSVLGGGKYFRSPKSTKTQLQQCRIQILSRDNTPDPRFKGKERLFLFSENEPNSPTIMPNSNIFRGTTPRTFVLGEKNVRFRSQKMYRNSNIAMLNSNIFSETIPRTPILGRGKYVFVLQKCTITLLQQCRIHKFSGGQYPGPSF